MRGYTEKQIYKARAKSNSFPKNIKLGKRTFDDFSEIYDQQNLNFAKIKENVLQRPSLKTHRKATKFGQEIRFLIKLNYT